LREIGVELGVPSYLIADAGRWIPAGWQDAGRGPFTAGASAPEALVLEVIRACAASPTTSW